MENAFDALKMAFAVIVFVIAMAIAFSLLGQANATAREIFYSMDKTTYLDPIRVGGEEAVHRTVGMETIIPTIYRYSVENCGVTIIDKDGNIIARYDRETQNVSKDIEKYSSYDRNDLKKKSHEYETAYKNYLLHMNYLTQILIKVEATSGKNINLRNNLEDNLVTKSKVDGKTEYRYSEILDDTIKVLYSYTNNITGTHYGATPWQSNEAKRLEADFSGKAYQISDEIFYYPFGKNKDKNWQKSLENGLMDYLNGKSFTEYTINEGTTYFRPKYDEYGKRKDEMEEVKTNKLEIIYIEQ